MYDTFAIYLSISNATKGHQYSKATRLTGSAAAIIHNCKQHQHAHTHTLLLSLTSTYLLSAVPLQHSHCTIAALAYLAYLP